MLGTARADATEASESRRRLGAILILILALLGIGIGGFPGGGDGQPEVTVGLSSGNDATPTPVRTPTPESGTPTPGGPGGGGGDGSDDGAGSGSSDGDGAEPTAGDVDTTTAGDDVSASDDGYLSLRVRKDEMRGRVDNVMPGDSGNVSLDVTNVGNRSGRFSVTVGNVTDFENGLTEPELSGGDTGGIPGTGQGELSSHLRVRWSIEGPEGEREYLFGSESGYRPIGALDGATGEATSPVLEENESATALFEWKVPKGTGNAIQSDSVRFDADFALTAPDELGLGLQ